MRFRERQGYARWWLWAIVAPTALTAWWGFVQQVVLGSPWGEEPAPDAALWVGLAVVGVALPALLALARLVTEVDDAELRVRVRPLPPRAWPLDRIADVERARRSPAGGLGSGAADDDHAFVARSRDGVRVRLADGTTAFVGSRRPDELAAALRGDAG